MLIMLGCMTLLNGCAIMSKSECLNANWAAIGQRDGINGAGAKMQERGHACAKHEIAIDRKLYTEGYKKGLKTYCNPQAVFDFALQGKGDYQSCPLEMHNELRPYYSVANSYFSTKKNLNSIEQGIANARSSLQKSDLKEKDKSYYRGIVTRNSELLPQARRDFYEAERNLQQFKKSQSLVY